MNTRVFPANSFNSAVGQSACIVCCTSVGCRWKWLSAELGESTREWYFFHDNPKTRLERWLPRFGLAAIRASWQAVSTAKRRHAKLLITGNATLTFWCALFAALRNLTIEQIAVSFHLHKLPSGLMYSLARWAYGRVQRFVVHSRCEKQLYGEYFGLPLGRFEMQHWGGETPEYQPAKPLEAGEYICAIAQGKQDYRTLLAAMSTLPDIPLVIVVPRKHAIARPHLPNVQLRVGLSPVQTMNVLKHSRFLVMPLCPHDSLCDPGLLVAAMHLHKAFVAADLPSISDYAFHNSNGVLYKPHNPKALAAAIRDLWDDVLKCEVLGENGKGYAEAFCSQDSTRKYYQRLLSRRGV